MKFQQIRSATSIVTFANRRFLIDPMLSAQGTYPAVPDTTSTGRGNPDCDLPCPIQDLFNVDAVWTGALKLRTTSMTKIT